MATSTVGIKLDDETRRRLQALGQRRDRSPNWLMKTAIRQYLDREEGFERERQEDEERWQRYLDSGAHIDNATMMAWLDGFASEAEKRAEERADQDSAPHLGRQAAADSGEWS